MTTVSIKYVVNKTLFIFDYVCFQDPKELEAKMTEVFRLGLEGLVLKDLIVRKLYVLRTINYISVSVSFISLDLFHKLY